MHRSRSHWFESAGPYVPSDPLQQTVHVDICVIGGGVTGVSAAYHVRRADPRASVALLESEVIGFGASGRNAGQLIVTLGENDFRAQLKRHGVARLREAYAYVQSGITTIEELIGEHAIECDYARTGYFEMGLRADGDDVLDDYLAFCKAIGQGEFLESVSAEQVAREFSSPYFGKACFDRRGGQFNPLKYVRGLKRAAEQMGARFFENSPVVSIERAPDCITLRTGKGVVRCRKLVLATNAYSHLLPGVNDLKMGNAQSPVFVYANVTEPLSASHWEQLKWPRRAAVNIMSKVFYSFAPTHDGRLLYVGGYYAGVPGGKEMSLDISKGFMADGPRHLASFFPALSNVATAQSWGGPISTTRDFIPHVGLLDDSRVGHALGCWGHGIPLGTRNGRTLADLVLERPSADSQSWLVTRSKMNWPSRLILTPIVKGLSYTMRRDIRKVARRMEPSLTFSE